MLVLEIPTGQMPTDFIKELDELLVLLEQGRYCEVYQIGKTIDCAVTMERPIPPEWLVSHHTPKRIVDTEDRTRVFTFD
ncbi:MAG TPA: hypothetical protein VNX28_02275 [Gemmataceae bacterium]|nr:hypothetical protein [Gemmataceae bacterium]